VPPYWPRAKTAVVTHALANAIHSRALTFQAADKEWAATKETKAYTFPLLFILHLLPDEKVPKRKTRVTRPDEIRGGADLTIFGHRVHVSIVSPTGIFVDSIDGERLSPCITVPLLPLSSVINEGAVYRK